MAKALVARDNKLITAIVMDGARVKMARAGNNQMVTAVRAKARAACLRGVRSRLAMGLVTVAMDSRLTMVATGIWLRAMAGARVKMVRAGNNQMVTAARAKARAIMGGMGSRLAMVARGGLTTVEPRARTTPKLACMPLKKPLH